MRQGPLAEPVPLDPISLPPRLDPHLLRELGKKLGTVVNTSPKVRILRAYGKGYKDLVRLRRGCRTSAPRFITPCSTKWLSQFPMCSSAART